MSEKLVEYDRSTRLNANPTTDMIDSMDKVRETGRALAEAIMGGAKLTVSGAVSRTHQDPGGHHVGQRRNHSGGSMSELDNVQHVAEAGQAGRSYLFYGPAGSGKTTLAAMHPGKRKLWLDVDQKLHEMEVLPNRGAISVWSPREPLGNPERIEIPWSPDPKNVQQGTIPAKKPLGYEKLVAVTNDLLKQARSPEGLDYDCVVLDTLTAVGDHWGRLLMYTHRVSFMTERLWGIYLAGMMEYLNGFLTLPCDRIVIAHEKRRTDEDTKQDVIRPSVAGQMGDNLVRFFTEAYWLSGRERSGKYKLQTVTANGAAARTSRRLDPETLAGPEIFA